MTYKLPTKKEIAAYRKSAKATLDELGFRPATPVQSQAPDGHRYTIRDYEIDTTAGLLYCSIHGDWLACVFEDVWTAREHPELRDTDRLNPHSGKWNWDALGMFQLAVQKIAIPKGYETDRVIGGYVWKHEELDICSDRIFDIRVEAALGAVTHSQQ